MTQEEIIDIERTPGPYKVLTMKSPCFHCTEGGEWVVVYEPEDTVLSTSHTGDDGKELCEYEADILNEAYARGGAPKEMPQWAKLLLECRDALPAITLDAAKLHNIDSKLADRIEAALEPWRVIPPCDKDRDCSLMKDHEPPCDTIPF